MAKRKKPELAPIYDVAERWVAVALRTDGSLLTEGKPIWSLANVEDLFARTAGQPDVSTVDDFEVKLRRQLDGAPPEIYQLAAEELVVYSLVTMAIGGKRKRELIHEVLSWAPAATELPARLAAVMDVGLVNPGTAYNTSRPMQLWFLLDFVRTFKKLPVERRAQVLGDPWALRDLLYSLAPNSAFTMREALLHLIQPETFEAITSQKDKRNLAAAFPNYVTDKAANVDKQIVEIRSGLTPEHGSNFDFYAPGVRSIWKPEGPPAPPPPGSPTASRTLSELLEFVLANYLNAKRTEPNGRVSPTWLAVEEMERLLREHPLVKSAPTLVVKAATGSGEWSAVPWAAVFDKRETLSVKSGIYVVLLFRADMSGVYVTFNQGVSEVKLKQGPTEPKAQMKKPDAMALLRARAVESRKLDCTNLPDHGFNIDDDIDLRVGPGLGADYQVSTIAYKLYERGSVPSDASIDADLGALLVSYGHYLERMLGTPVDVPVVDERLLPVLMEIANAIEHRGQVILYGPPGTGKTFTAMAFARWWLSQKTGRTISDALPGDGSIGQLTRITFHPSYGYEDFVEGYRPVESEDESQLVLRPTDGTFKRICTAAGQDKEEPYLLLIDEINRGNIPRIFGELITILEIDKRGSDVRLPQSQKPFSVPPNVHLLGTMNTADRSIRLLDTALRRRFAFIELMPDPSLVSPAMAGPLDLGRFMTELNKRIAETEGRERQVGHSFFLEANGKPVSSAIAFATRFRLEILPLLQEYAYDDPARLQKFLGKELVSGDPLDLNHDLVRKTEPLLAALAREYAPQP